MKKKGETYLGVMIFGLLAFLAVVPAASSLAETSDSSACIDCHTDLDAMDSYSAAAAKGGAGIAG